MMGSYRRSAEGIASMAGGLILDFWNEWETQIVVLWSLMVQVGLYLLAGVRRHKAPVMQAILWVAYQMADAAALYALGQLSLISKVPGERQLVAFWTPFLLLHLGGPDNISAYALEDSKLWRRHLLTLLMQVTVATYVLYKYGLGGDSLIFRATVLMFTVGVVKYWERTLAIKNSNLDSIRTSLKQKEQVVRHHHFHPPDYYGLDAVEGDEFYVRRAHYMFDICKRAIADASLVMVVEDDSDQSSLVDIDVKKEQENPEGMWTLMEMELSLLYDLLYTKASMVYTWRGYAIRVLSSLTVAASFLLFHFSRSKDGYGRINVVVSYTLLAGAFLLETASLLSAVGSTWSYAFLCNTEFHWLKYAVLCSGRWDRLRWLVKAITPRRCWNKRSVRRWSGKIGQYNMLHVGSRFSRAYVPLLAKFACMVGCGDWWIRHRYSGAVEFSEDLKERLFMYAKRRTKDGVELNMQGVIRENWGQQVFDEFHPEMKDLYDRLKKRKLLGVEFQEGIIIWHIATEVFIAKSRGHGDEDHGVLVGAIRTLSNYLMFLLVNSPYMLPGLGHSMLYWQTLKNLAEMWIERPDHQKGGAFMKLKDFFSWSDRPESAGVLDVEKLANIIFEKKPPATDKVPRLNFAFNVAKELMQRQTSRKDMLELLLDVWMDFLVYAANRCSRESHARKLGSGGELIIILWLMTGYLHCQAYVDYAKSRRRG